jgi:hypothetical protein
MQLAYKRHVPCWCDATQLPLSFSFIPQRCPVGPGYSAPPLGKAPGPAPHMAAGYGLTSWAQVLSKTCYRSRGILPPFSEKLKDRLERYGSAVLLLFIIPNRQAATIWRCAIPLNPGKGTTFAIAVIPDDTDSDKKIFRSFEKIGTIATPFVRTY